MANQQLLVNLLEEAEIPFWHDRSSDSEIHVISIDFAQSETGFLRSTFKSGLSVRFEFIHTNLSGISVERS